MRRLQCVMCLALSGKTELRLQKGINQFASQTCPVYHPVRKQTKTRHQHSHNKTSTRGTYPSLNAWQK